MWLTAGDTYRFDLNGIAPTHLRGGVIQGLYDPAGQYIPNTYYSGPRHITYTADYTGAHHLVIRQRSHCIYCPSSNTFEFVFREEAVPVTSGPPPSDPIELTTMSGWPSQELAWGLHILKPYERLWYRVTVDRILAFSATLSEQLTNANLLLFDADRNVLAESVNPGTANEHVEITLAAGDYYVVVEAQEDGAGGHTLEVQSQAPLLEDLLALGGEFQLLNRPEFEDEDFPADTSTIGRILVDSSLTGWVLIARHRTIAWRHRLVRSRFRTRCQLPDRARPANGSSSTAKLGCTTTGIRCWPACTIQTGSSLMAPGMVAIAAPRGQTSACSTQQRRQAPTTSRRAALQPPGESTA